MRQLVEQLLAAGQRSARVATLLALQLSGVWTVCPLSALRYRDTIQALCLYGLSEQSGGEQVGRRRVQKQSGVVLPEKILAMRCHPAISSCLPLSHPCPVDLELRALTY